MNRPKKILDVEINYKDLEGEDYDGAFKDATLFKDQSIDIHKGLPAAELKIILGHELVHYAFARSGFSAILRAYSGGTDALEEGAVVAIQNHLITTGVLIVNPKYFKE